MSVTRMEEGKVLFYRVVRKHGFNSTFQFVRLKSGKRISRSNYDRKTAPGHKVFVCRNED